MGRCSVFKLLFRYVDRLTESLQHKLKLSEKMQASCKAVAERKQEAATHQSELEPKLDVIVKKTKQLQQQVCISVGTVGFVKRENMVLCMLKQQHKSIQQYVLLGHAG